ncbi:MAG: glutamate racemase [Reinekea sp.]|jgi:glutamate racemase
MIGVFDSGIGGLTILTKIHQHLPDEALLYFADQAFSPYGNLSAQIITQRSELIIQYLIDQGAHLVVIACNTATAVAIDQMRERFSIPIVGVEPGIKPAALNSQTRKIGILATENTVASSRYTALMQRFVPHVEVLSQPCKGLADAIEQGSDEVPVLLEQYVGPLLEASIDHLVLGCTHYPLMKDKLAQMVSPGVMLVDTGDAVAMEVGRRLPERRAIPYQITLMTSGQAEAFAKIILCYDDLRWLDSAEIQVVPLLQSIP